MRLTPMRYKDYIWPSNPGSYRISFRRVVAEHKLPFGRSVTQDLGQVCRVLEGEGEFAGEGAYEEFKRRAAARRERRGRGITPWCRATRFGPSRRETAQRCARCVRSTRRSRTRIGSIPESG